jgi:NAD-dependent deacetylase
MSSIEEAINAIRTIKPRKVVFMTGAGVSADSGIPTFRGPGGFWRNFRPEQLATPDAFRRDPALVWEWYEWRRGLIREAKPNLAHESIARIADAIVVTQNVDGLHARAGSADIVELHGNIFRVRCVREETSRVHEQSFDTIPPQCECGALLRPDVVWFGEELPPHAVARTIGAMTSADVVIVIGTSGVVYPAAGFLTMHEGLSIEVNPETSAVSSTCTYAIPMRAAEATPAIVEALLEVR